MNISEILPLMDHYPKSGPRYTSYPTANHFSESFDRKAYERIAQASNQQPLPRPLSLYIHVPFCKSLCYYCGCNKIVTRKQETVDNYLDHLYREIAMHGELFASDRFVEQVHIGGGTPTYLSPDQLEELMDMVAQAFHFAPPNKVQMSIEVDPRTVSPEQAAELVSVGFNRISLGVQDLDPLVQKTVNREQTAEQIEDIVTAVRRAGVNAVSFDLMYGLPHQTINRFVATLEEVIRLRPDSISLYNYAHMPDRVPSQRLIPTDALPLSHEKLNIFSLAHRALSDAGYLYLGMDHFVLPDTDLARAFSDGSIQRNFQGYSTHGDCDIIGMGVSAISRVNGCYSQNSTDIKEYRTLIDSGVFAVKKGYALNSEDLLRAEIIQKIMCDGNVNLEEICSHSGVIWEQHFYTEIDRLRAFEGDGLVELTSRGFRVTENGRYFLRPIAMVFDEWLQTAEIAGTGLPKQASAGYSKVF